MYIYINDFIFAVFLLNKIKLLLVYKLFDLNIKQKIYCVKK